MSKKDSQDNTLYEIELIRQQAYEEGFQEAVKQMKDIIRGEGEKGNAEEMVNINYIDELFDYLKPIPDQGAESEGK